MSTIDGGVENKRGLEFERRSILYYLLLRYYEHAEIEAIIEPYDLPTSEDAVLTYRYLENGCTREISEIIQCKKRENSTSNDIHFGISLDDRWNRGGFGPDDLKECVGVPRPVPVCDIIANDDTTYYTLLLFGKPYKKTVGRFVPERLRDTEWMNIPNTTFWKDFPLDYRHEVDPAMKSDGTANSSVSDIGLPTSRCRIRILHLGSPQELRLCTWSLLEQLYHVLPAQVERVMDALLNAIDKCGLQRSADETRVLTGGSIEDIIASGRSAPGAWLALDTFLGRDSSREAFLNDGEALTWSDFSSGRYASRDVFDKAFDAIERKGYTVVWGPVGAGKSTLARYVAYKFLSSNPGRSGYYLLTTPAISLNQEAEFAVHQFEADTLFIIDDEQFAPTAVMEITKRFQAVRIPETPKARLLVISTRRFSDTKADLYENPLHEAPSIIELKLDRSGAEALRIIESQISSGLETSLSALDIARMSQGNLGLALCIARSARWKYRDDHKLRLALESWITKSIGSQGNPRMFTDGIVPIMVIASWGLPVPEDWAQEAVTFLACHGFLECESNYTAYGRMYRAASITLAELVADSFAKDRDLLFTGYVSRYPKMLPLVCERLASQRSDSETPERLTGEKILLELCRGSFACILEPLKNRDEPLDLAGIAMILRSISKVSSGEGLRLVRELLTPGGDTATRAFANYIVRKTLPSATSVAEFLHAAIDIDRYTVRQTARDSFDDELEQYLMEILCDVSCSLHEAATCLNSITKCHKDFGKQLYAKYRMSEAFTQKVSLADNDSNGMSFAIWLNFCENMRRVDRDDCMLYLKEKLSAELILEAIHEKTDLYKLSFFLRRLRRLYPKLAVKVIEGLWGSGADSLEHLVRRESVLTVAVSDLYSIGKMNRRLAIQAAHRSVDHLGNLVREEGEYHKIAAALNTLSKAVGFAVAKQVAHFINGKLVREQMLAEQHRVALVGRFLYTLSEIDGELAESLSRTVDYRVFTKHIRRRKLYNWIHLVRGFLAAAGATRNRQDLAKKMMSDPKLCDHLSYGWKHAPNLSHVAFCLIELTKIGLGASEIACLLGLENSISLEEDVLPRFLREDSCLHVANGLFAIAKVDIGMARRILCSYVAECVKRNERANGNRNMRTTFPVGRQPDDLVHVGGLLQVAAAIDSEKAADLAGLIVRERFIHYSKDEANLGRLAIFIRGLHAASRALARQFIDKLDSDEVRQRQYEEETEAENMVHYVRALATVSCTKGGDYARAVVAAYQDDILEQLRIEANIKLVSNWLRLVPLANAELPKSFTNKVAELVSECLEYDMRLPHMLEAVEALAMGGYHDDAAKLADRCIREKAQIRSIHSLHSWVTLWFRCVHIGAVLNRQTFLNELIGTTSKEQFEDMLDRERNEVVIGFVNHMRSLEVMDSSRDLLAVLRPKLQPVLSRLEKDTSLSNIVAYLLANGDVSRVKAAAQDFVWDRAWEKGLAALMFSIAYPSEANPFVSISGSTVPSWSDTVRRGLTEHTSNLEYALALLVTDSEAFSESEMASHKANAVERAKDESVTATVWLLQQQNLNNAATILPYYLWTYLNSTILESTYLAREGEVEEAADEAYF